MRPIYEWLLLHIFLIILSDQSPLENGLTVRECCRPQRVAETEVLGFSNIKSNYIWKYFFRQKKIIHCRLSVVEFP